MKHKYVIFDLDGTLSDSENSIITTLKQTFSHLGISEPPYETLRRFIRHSRIPLCATAASANGRR